MRKMLIYFCTVFFFLPLVNNKINQTVKFGDNVPLDCIENKTPVTYIYWKYKNVTKNVTWKDIFWCINNESKTYTPFENVIYPAGDFKTGNYSITLRSITFEYGGQYVCYTQINGSGANQTSPVFDINVVGWKRNVIVPSGNILNLYLHTNESVQLHFWRNGEKHNVGKIQINSQKCDLDNRYKNRSKMDNEVLIINNVTPDDAGIYTVQDERSGKNISIVRVEITSPKDSSNSSSKNSTEQGTLKNGTLICVVVIGIIVLIALFIGCIYLCKKYRTSGPINGRRFIASYQSAPREDN